MSIFSRIGATPRCLAAAAVSFSLFAGTAVAQNGDGYVDVRVRDDNAGCGPVVVKWNLDQEEREYDPNPAANDPKLDMAETRPLPVIHQHPALNAGSLYLPPQDGLYRHYFPESEAPPRLRRWIRPVYEEYLRDNNPSTDVPFANDLAYLGESAIPGAVIVPTGLATPPATFDAGQAGYVVAPAGSVAPLPAEAIGVIGVPAAVSAVSDTIVPVPAGAPALMPVVQPVMQSVAPVTPAASGAVTDEGTASFIHLSGEAEKIPYVQMPAALSASVPAEAPAAVAPAGVTVPQAMVPAFTPGDATLPMGKCGTPACQ